MTLTEKPQKYQDHCMEELINMNILQAKKYYLLIKKNTIESANFAYSFSENYFEKQTVKQVGAIISLKPSNKRDKLKQRVYFHKN